MATTPKVLARAAAATSSATLYTVPASTTTIVTNVAVTNTAGSSATFTIALNSVVLIPAATIAANSTAFFDIKQVLATTQTITGFASATTVNFHISGVELV
jgi:glucan phosphoethanolaminetransferase (alkaline phosphatase superfamily)